MRSKRIFRKRSPAVQFDPLNFPAPIYWQNKSIFKVINEYHTGIKAMFQDAQDVGVTAEVHTIQMFPTSSGWTIVAFVHQDLYAHAIQKKNHAAAEM